MQKPDELQPCSSPMRRIRKKKREKHANEFKTYVRVAEHELCDDTTTSSQSKSQSIWSWKNWYDYNNMNSTLTT